MVFLCSTEEVSEGTPVAIELEGFPPLAVYNVAGDYYVTSNVCTHSDALLTDGFQEDDEIECAVHGGMFNIRTGEATAFPCNKPLKTYPVTIAGGRLSITIANVETHDGGGGPATAGAET